MELVTRAKVVAAATSEGWSSSQDRRQWQLVARAKVVAAVTSRDGGSSDEQVWLVLITRPKVVVAAMSKLTARPKVVGTIARTKVVPVRHKNQGGGSSDEQGW